MEPDVSKVRRQWDPQRVSPFARKMARDANINLDGISGSGPNGRVVARDIENAKSYDAKEGDVTVADAAAQLAPQRSEVALRPERAGHEHRHVPMSEDDKTRAVYTKESYDLIPHDGMRQAIAERLTFSKQSIPHYRLNVTCNIDALLSARSRMNDMAPVEGANSYKLSVNDFIVKAMALALQSVPAANSSWTGEAMLRHKYSDVGVAVAIDGGLYTPIVRHCELKSLSEISNEIKELAEQARQRRLTPDQYQGGSTTVSNLGMYDIDSFDAVINPPQASILAVGAGQKTPVIANGEVTSATMMRCALSCDHRVIDGAVGAEFLKAFKRFIEDPVHMLI